VGTSLSLKKLIESQRQVNFRRLILSRTDINDWDSSKPSTLGIRVKYFDGGVQKLGGFTQRRSERRHQATKFQRSAKDVTVGLHHLEQFRTGALVLSIFFSELGRLGTHDLHVGSKSAEAFYQKSIRELTVQPAIFSLLNGLGISLQDPALCDNFRTKILGTADRAQGFLSFDNNRSIAEIGPSSAKTGGV
jgi:hypothetical protein